MVSVCKKFKINTKIVQKVLKYFFKYVIFIACENTILVLINSKPKVQKEVNMKKYELMYVLLSNTSDEEKDAMIEKVNALLTKNNAVIESTEKLGNKKLAYEIDKKHEGFYVLTNFEANANVPATVTNTLRITEGILRFIIVAK